MILTNKPKNYFYMRNETTDKDENVDSEVLVQKNNSTKKENSIAKQKSNVARKESNSTKKENNIEKKESNITKQKSNVVKKESNITKQKSDVVKKESNITKQKSDVVKKKSNITKQKSDVVKKKSNITKQKSDVVKKKSDVVKKKSDVVKKKSDVVKKKNNVVKQKNNIDREEKNLGSKTINIDWKENNTKWKENTINREEQNMLEKFGWFYLDEISNSVVEAIYAENGRIKQKGVDRNITNYFRDNQCEELKRMIEIWKNDDILRAARIVLKEALEFHMAKHPKEAIEILIEVINDQINQFLRIRQKESTDGLSGAERADLLGKIVFDDFAKGLDESTLFVYSQVLKSIVEINNAKDDKEKYEVTEVQTLKLFIYINILYRLFNEIEDLKSGKIVKVNSNIRKQVLKSNNINQDKVLIPEINKTPKKQNVSKKSTDLDKDNILEETKLQKEKQLSKSKNYLDKEDKTLVAKNKAFEKYGWFSIDNIPEDIVALAQETKSKSKKENIDMRIAKYFSDDGYSNLKNLLEKWHANSYFAVREKTLAEAFKYYRRKQYSKSIDILVQQIKRVITRYVNIKFKKSTKGLRIENIIDVLENQTLKEYKEIGKSSRFSVDKTVFEDLKKLYSLLSKAQKIPDVEVETLKLFLYLDVLFELFERIKRAEDVEEVKEKKEETVEKSNVSSNVIESKKNNSFEKYGWFYIKELPEEVVDSINIEKKNTKKETVDAEILKYFSKENSRYLKQVINSWGRVKVFAIDKDKIKYSLEQYEKENYDLAIKELRLFFEKVAFGFVKNNIGKDVSGLDINKVIKIIGNETFIEKRNLFTVDELAVYSTVLQHLNENIDNKRDVNKVEKIHVMKAFLWLNVVYRLFNGLSTRTTVRVEDNTNILDIKSSRNDKLKKKKKTDIVVVKKNAIKKTAETKPIVAKKRISRRYIRPRQEKNEIAYYAEVVSRDYFEKPENKDWLDKHEMLVKHKWFYCDELPTNVVHGIYSNRDKISDNRVSNNITKYFRDNEYEQLTKMVNMWNQNKVFRIRKTVFKEALDNHIRGNYYSSIIILTLHIEGVITEFFDVYDDQNVDASFMRVIIDNIMPDAIKEKENIFKERDLAVYYSVLETIREISTESFSRKKLDSASDSSRNKMAHGHVVERSTEAYSLKLFLYLNELFKMFFRLERGSFEKGTKANRNNNNTEKKQNTHKLKEKDSINVVNKNIKEESKDSKKVKGIDNAKSLGKNREEGEN